MPTALLPVFVMSPVAMTVTAPLEVACAEIPSELFPAVARLPVLVTEISPDVVCAQIASAPLPVVARSPALVTEMAPDVV